MRIAFILSRFPWPLEKGDKLRAYNFIRYLSLKNEIYLYSISETNLNQEMVDALQPYCKSIFSYRMGRFKILKGVTAALFTGLPLQVGYFFNKSVSKEIKEHIKIVSPDLVFCQLIRTAEYARGLDKPKAIDFQDSFSLNMQRRKEKSGILKRLVFSREMRTLKRYEHKILSEFQYHSIIAEPDRQSFISPDNRKINIIANGVDFSFFTPDSDSTDKEIDLLFLGNMSYAPNVDSACYLVKEVMPLIWKEIPGVKLLIAGANPSERVKRLKQKNVEVSGWIPDIREAYSKSRVFIAPMRMGSGLQNKLLEAMAMQLPSITTSLANSSLRAVPDKEILIGDSAIELANAVIKLLQQSEFAKSIAVNGYKMVREKYEWEKIIALLDEKLNKTIL